MGWVWQGTEQWFARWNRIVIRSHVLGRGDRAGALSQSLRGKPPPSRAVQPSSLLLHPARPAPVSVESLSAQLRRDDLNVCDGELAVASLAFPCGLQQDMDRNLMTGSLIGEEARQFNYHSWS